MEAHKDWVVAWFDPALQKCIREKLYSVNDFRDVVHYLKQSRIEGLSHE